MFWLRNKKNNFQLRTPIWRACMLFVPSAVYFGLNTQRVSEYVKKKKTFRETGSASYKYSALIMLVSIKKKLNSSYFSLKTLVMMPDSDTSNEYSQHVFIGKIRFDTHPV